MMARIYPMVRRGAFSRDTPSGQRVTGELTLSIGSQVV